MRPSSRGATSPTITGPIASSSESSAPSRAGVDVRDERREPAYEQRFTYAIAGGKHPTATAAPARGIERGVCFAAALGRAKPPKWYNGVVQRPMKSARPARAPSRNFLLIAAFPEGERGDSNPRPPGPQPGALPAELRPPWRGLNLAMHRRCVKLPSHATEEPAYRPSFLILSSVSQTVRKSSCSVAAVPLGSMNIAAPTPP